MEFSTQQVTYKYTHNEAAYSKLAMAPLWSDVLAHLLTHTPANRTILEEEWPEEQKRYGNKFALYSAHDSTLMALLAHLDEAKHSFWDATEWPPYASMFLIELYNVTMSEPFLGTEESNWYDTGVAFRLLFNGEVMTDSLEGCQDELCDIAILILHLYGESSITDWDLRCEQSESFKALMAEDDDDDDEDRFKPIDPEAGEKPKHHLSTFGRNLGVFCALLMSGMIGALITYSIMMKKMMLNSTTMEERSTLELTESGGGAPPSHPINSTGQIPANHNDVPEDGPIYGLNVDRAVVT